MRSGGSLHTVEGPELMGVSGFESPRELRGLRGSRVQGV